MTVRIFSVCAQNTAMLVIAFLAGLAIGAWPPVDAHTAVTYFPRTWDSDPSYAFGQLEAPFNTTGAKYAIHSGDNPWNGVYGSTLDFRWSGKENPHVFWQGSGCATAPSNGLWIITDDLPNLATESTCVSGDTIIRSVIRFDNVGTTWYMGVDSSVPSGQIDLRSVAVHEFGHSAGFAGHFTETSICSGSTRQTMCQGTPAGTSYRRTLETHDKHTFVSAYPAN